MSLKINLLYGYILTIANYLFPLIVFPYVTRTLGAENIGICNWVSGIIDYYVMFSMMGISTLGVREIASSKCDRRVLNKTFSALLYLNMMTTVLAVIALLVSTLYITSFYEYKEFFFVGCSKLITNLFLIEWFYKGIEDFKFITKRTVYMRILYIASVFIFIRERDDYMIYFILTIGVCVINAIINVLYSRNFVTIVQSRIPKVFITSFITLGVYNLLNSAYSTFNVAYLGIVHSKAQVGFYTTATKVFMIILTLYGTWTTVVMPRISSLLVSKDYERITQLVNVSLNILYSIAIPVMIVGFTLSEEIIGIVGGAGFAPAIPLLKIAFLMLPICGIEQVMVIQVMMPFKADKRILLNSVISATVGICLGMYLIREFAALGSIMTWVLIELCVFITSIISTRRIIKINIFTSVLWKVLSCSIAYIGFCYGVVMIFHDAMWRIILICIPSLIWFYISNRFIIKDETILVGLRKIEENIILWK